ncbi:MAG: signal peptidase I [Verrucomicrobiota bacterium]
MNEQDTTMNPRRWIGVLLSLFVPGFGLVRAGRIKRAAIWFITLILVSLLTGILLAQEKIPFFIAVASFISAIGVQIAMLCDSFRAGRMTGKLWAIYVGIFTLLLLAPPPISVLVKAFSIPTNSMAPTLMGTNSSTGSDHVIVDRISYLFGSPQRGDLVVFKTSGISGIQQFRGEEQSEVFYVMRLIGLPEESISISDGAIFADGVKLESKNGILPFTKYLTAAEIPVSGFDEKSDFRVKENEYFVLGDNSPNSLDSRFWGGVPEDAIIGKVTTIYYPFSRAGRITQSE